MERKLEKIEEWKAVAETVSNGLQHPLLLLKGNLGAGKTTFTRFLLRQLGSTDDITSPTYSVVNEYDTPKGKVFHLDLYRLNSAREVYDIGIEEYLDHGFLCIIEWPEIFEEGLRDLPYHEMSINREDHVRTVTFH